MSKYPSVREVSVVLAVVSLLILSGCIGSGNQPQPVGPDKTEPETGGLLADPPTQNPWESDNITVRITHNPRDRDYEPLIKESLRYWNQHLSALGWEGEFSYNESVETPDVAVHILNEIEECGTERSSKGEPLMGCAPLYNQTGQARYNTDPVEIVGGLNNSSTVDVATHEFGHTLGLTHGDVDQWPIMNETTSVATTERPNATDRSNPFEADRIAVYYNGSQHRINDRERRELSEVWSYFNNGGSEIVPSNVSFEETNNKSKASVEVRFVDDLDGGGISTAQWYGYDPDADGAFETYDTATIYIGSTVDQHDVAWHTGRWITYLFSSQEEGALPDDLTTRSAYTRRQWPS